MLLPPGSSIIGNFALKFSPSDFGTSLTHSNRPRSSAQWELFSERNKNEPRRAACVATPQSNRLYERRRLEFTRFAALTPILFTGPRNGDNEFAVFLGDKVFALAG